MEKRKSGKPLSAAAAKVRKHMEAMTPEGLKELTLKVYQNRTHHYDCTAGAFNYEKMRALRIQGVPKRIQAPRQARASAPLAPAAPGTGARAVSILASIDLAAFSDTPPKALKVFAAELLKQSHPQGARVEILLLSDPPTLEIRVPA